MRFRPMLGQAAAAYACWRLAISFAGMARHLSCHVRNWKDKGLALRTSAHNSLADARLEPFGPDLD